MSTLPTDPDTIIDQALAGHPVPDDVRRRLIDIVADCQPVDERDLSAPMREGVHYYGYQVGPVARRRQ